MFKGTCFCAYIHIIFVDIPLENDVLYTCIVAKHGI
jgi:hypothetical protein